MLDLTHYIQINICLSSKDKLRFKCPQGKGVGTKSGLYLPTYYVSMRNSILILTD